MFRTLVHLIEVSTASASFVIVIDKLTQLINLNEYEAGISWFFLWKEKKQKSKFIQIKYLLI